MNFYTYVIFSLASLTATFTGDNYIQYGIDTQLSIRPTRQTNFATSIYTTSQNSISLSFATSRPSGVILQLGRPSESHEYAFLEVKPISSSTRY